MIGLYATPRAITSSPRPAHWQSAAAGADGYMGGMPAADEALRLDPALAGWSGERSSFDHDPRVGADVPVARPGASMFDRERTTFAPRFVTSPRRAMANLRRRGRVGPAGAAGTCAELQHTIPIRGYRATLDSTSEIEESVRSRRRRA
jgi:hypothetical protein